MPDEMRTCRRTGCRWPAVASLAFRYDTREVWLEGLPDEAHPAAYDLCPHHAESMTVPRGWQLIDRRTAAVPPREPAGRDLPGAQAVTDADGGAGPLPDPPHRTAGRNRYAALSANLPRLAAEHARGRDDGMGRRPAGSAAEVAGREPAPYRPPPAGGELPSAPPDVPEEIEGQLAMPVVAEVGPSR